MNHVEVIDLDAPAIPFIVEQELMRYYRPDETLADTIAAATLPGEIEIAPMIALKPTYGESCPHKGCSLCSTSETETIDYAVAVNSYRDAALKEYGVEWDPTITF